MKRTLRCPRCVTPIGYDRHPSGTTQRLSCPSCHTQLEITRYHPFRTLFFADGKTSIWERYQTLPNTIRTQLFVLVVSLVMCILFLVLGLLLPA